MKVKGFELKQRYTYDVEINGGESIVHYAKALFDSIKINWKWYNKIWFRFKYSPSKLLKQLTKKEILQSIKYLFEIEGKPVNELAYIKYQLGEISEEEYNKIFDEILSKAEANKKKVERIKNLEK